MTQDQLISVFDATHQFGLTKSQLLMKNCRLITLNRKTGFLKEDVCKIYNIKHKVVVNSSLMTDVIKKRMTDDKKNNIIKSLDEYFAYDHITKLIDYNESVVKSSIDFRERNRIVLTSIVEDLLKKQSTQLKAESLIVQQIIQKYTHDNLLQPLKMSILIMDELQGHILLDKYRSKRVEFINNIVDCMECGSYTQRMKETYFYKTYISDADPFTYTGNSNYKNVNSYIKLMEFERALDEQGVLRRLAFSSLTTEDVELYLNEQIDLETFLVTVQLKVNRHILNSLLESFFELIALPKFLLYQIKDTNCYSLFLDGEIGMLELLTMEKYSFVLDYDKRTKDFENWSYKYRYYRVNGMARQWILFMLYSFMNNKSVNKLKINFRYCSDSTNFIYTVINLNRHARIACSFDKNICTLTKYVF